MTDENYKQVSPKKLPAGLGWGVLVGQGGEAGEVVKVVTRRGKEWLATLVEEVQYGVWSTDATESAIGQTRERLENRADRREEWAESRDRKAEESWDASRRAVDGIPLGQPILVGHHSERGHRKAIDTAQRKATESVEHLAMSRRHDQAADTIRRQLRTSIYDDDEDAIEQLTWKLEELESERERIKDLNRRIRKGEPMETLGLTDSEKRDLQYAAQWHGRNTFPSYVLQNIGGNINRTKQRVARLKKFRGVE